MSAFWQKASAIRQEVSALWQAQRLRSGSGADHSKLYSEAVLIKPQADKYQNLRVFSQLGEHRKATLADDLSRPKCYRSYLRT